MHIALHFGAEKNLHTVRGNQSTNRKSSEFSVCYILHQMARGNEISVFTSKEVFLFVFYLDVVIFPIYRRFEAHSCVQYGAFFRVALTIVGTAFPRDAKFPGFRRSGTHMSINLYAV